MSHAWKAPILLAAVLLAGCVGTGSIEPRANLLDAARLDPGKAIAGAPAGSWPDVRWWSRWQDPQLDRLVAQALAGQPDLHIAQARLDLAQAQARIAGAPQFPHLDASGGFGRQHDPFFATPPPLGGQTVWSNEVGATFSYDLDLWGRNRAILLAALDAAHASAAELQGVRLALETSVVRAYIGLSLQYRLRDTDQAILELATRTYDIVEQRTRAGLASQLELSQAAARVAVDAAQVEQDDRGIALAGNLLAALSGQGPGAGEAIARPRLPPDVPVGLPSVLPAELVDRRPDVTAQRWRVEAASKGIAAARADVYPNIDLMAAFSLASTVPFGGFFNFVDGQGIGTLFGAAVSLPLFDGGRLRGRYGSAVAGYDAAVEAYNQSVLLAMRQVADQIVSLRSLALEQRQTGQAVAEARKACELALKGYRSGLTEFLDVLAARAELLRRQQQLAKPSSGAPLRTVRSRAPALGPPV